MAPGTWLRERRVELGKSLRKIAAEVGVSHVFVSEMERGVRPIPLPRVTSIASAYALDEEPLRLRVVEDMTARTLATLNRRVGA